jgi:hypothetical protein
LHKNGKKPDSKSFLIEGFLHHGGVKNKTSPFSGRGWSKLANILLFFSLKLEKLIPHDIITI